MLLKNEVKWGGVCGELYCHGGGRGRGSCRLCRLHLTCGRARAHNLEGPPACCMHYTVVLHVICLIGMLNSYPL